MTLLKARECTAAGHKVGSVPWFRIWDFLAKFWEEEIDLLKVSLQEPERSGAGRGAGWGGEGVCLFVYGCRFR